MRRPAILPGKPGAITYGQRGESGTKIISAQCDYVLTVRGTPARVRHQQRSNAAMTTTARTEIDGRTYEVVTDEAKRAGSLSSYCQVYRIRQDGTRGRQVVTISIIYDVLKRVRAPQ